MKTIQFPKLTPWQSAVYAAMENCRGTGKVFTIKAKRQVGKSILAAIELIKFAVEAPCISIIIEPTLTQCRRVFKDIQSWLDNTGLVENFNNSQFEIKFNNGSEIIFKSAEQRDRLRGFTVTGLLVIDEAAFIADEIIDIVFPFVDAHNAPTMIISTPLFKDGRFYTLYSAGLENKENAKAISFDWARYDTSQFLPKDKLDYYRKTVSPLKFTSEYLGEFITDGSFVFKNIVSSIKEPGPGSKPTYCGIDWGTGQNGDYTAVVFLDNNSNIHSVYKFNNIEPVQQVNEIARLINQNSTLISVTVEKNSIGTVFESNLKEKLNKKSILHTFTTTNESKRAIIEDLASAFENQSITIIGDDELIKELQHYTIEKTKSGKITYNGLLGYHDDLVMALAIAYNSTKKKTGYRILLK